MSKKQIKETARDNLMHAMMAAFYSEELSDELRDEMHNQVNRIESLFGFEKDSWQSNSGIQRESYSGIASKRKNNDLRPIPQPTRKTRPHALFSGGPYRRID